MAEDTRKLANANAGTVGGKTSATTNFNVAQLWQRQVPKDVWKTDFSKRDFEGALDKVSRQERTPERA